MEFSTKTAGAPADRSGPAHLELKVESIEMFINFFRIIGLPKSVGEIYGLLFISPKPLAMDDLMRDLNISLGAASQGLKLLRGFGAVKTVYAPGDRRDHYVADLELSRFATGFIKEQLEPKVERSLERIRRMEEQLGALSPEDRKATRERIDKLKHWLVKGQKMMPWVRRFLLR